MGVRTPSGSKRLTLEADATVADLYLAAAGILESGTEFTLLNGGKALSPSDAKAALADAGIKPGTLLTVRVAESDAAQEAKAKIQREHSLDEVDLTLYAMDGMIKRPPDSAFCRHPIGQMCAHCTPLEPWDPAILSAKDPPIKFLSFHAHLRKLDSGADRGRYTTLPDLKCTAFPPWPKDMSLHALPGTITLKRQKYRHVDYMQFENPRTLDTFIDYWRQTGLQRAGYLYGRYEPYDQVPLGIRAVVTAIYEPPQTATPTGLELLPDPQKELVDATARALGLVEVGWCFTDLVQGSEGIETTRGISQTNDDICELSSTEVLHAAHLQLQHPNVVPARYGATGGHFGSKYVTLVITGKENGVHLRAYQATHQAMCMVRDNVLGVACPSRVSVRPPSDQQFVPDVMFALKDEYGNEVKQTARPSFPVEFLLTDLQVGGHADSDYARFAVSGAAFVPCNRALLKTANAAAVRAHMDQEGELMGKLSDFQLLLFLATDEMCAPVVREALPDLLECVKTQNADNAAAWAQNGHWQTLLMLGQEQAAAAAIEASGGMHSGNNGGGAAATAAGGGGGELGGAGGTGWQCKHCTMWNKEGTDTCHMCSLPRS